MAVVAAGALSVARSGGGPVGPAAATVTARATTTSVLSVTAAPAPDTSTSTSVTSTSIVGGLAGGTGRLLPDHALHPGAVSAGVTAAQLCAVGFSTRVFRPPVSYTNRLKTLELGGGGTITGPSGAIYTVTGEHLPGAVSDYELDHLISLEIGGNPEDPRNLWMEPWERRGAHLAPTGQGAESKDLVENRLHREVCSGTITLAEAQTEVAGNWETAR